MSLPPSAAPAIDTERLTLRGFSHDDLADSIALWGDPATTRHIGGRPFTAEEVWTRLLRHLGHWALLGYGYWVVRERGTGRFVGEVGFADLHRALEPRLTAPEAGWVLAPWSHGRGYAGEAMIAAHAWLADRFADPDTRTVCIIAPDNAPSLRVAARLGYRELARATYHGDPAIVLERRP
jgi:RimJ/RimL family protein N-acetyltransferase